MPRDDFKFVEFLESLASLCDENVSPIQLSLLPQNNCTYLFDFLKFVLVMTHQKILNIIQNDSAT